MNSGIDMNASELAGYHLACKQIAEIIGIQLSTASELVGSVENKMRRLELALATALNGWQRHTPQGSAAWDHIAELRKLADGEYQL